jgi:serine/threonine protein kinase
MKKMSRKLVMMIILTTMVFAVAISIGVYAIISSTSTRGNIEITTDEINSTINAHTFTGTKIYMAPEIEKFNYNNKSDLWSIGVILYELYTNKYIFDSKYPKEREINRYDGKIINETDNEMINKLIRK